MSRELPGMSNKTQIAVFLVLNQTHLLYPIGSMYGIFANIYQ